MRELGQLVTGVPPALQAEVLDLERFGDVRGRKVEVLALLGEHAVQVGVQALRRGLVLYPADVVEEVVVLLIEDS